MYEFHKDKKRYYDMQYFASRDSIVPMIERNYELKEGCRVLEVGCAEGGVLKAFLEKSCKCTGIELMANRIELAKEFAKEDYEKGNIRFFSKNIYDIEASEDMTFDVIVLKDVIEHIPDQQKVLAKLKSFLRDDGVMFFGFPSWYMPYGGHQQICRTKWLAKLPWYHLLPMFLYRWILKTFNDKDQLEPQLDIKRTGMSTLRFNKISRRNGLEVKERIRYFIPPIYKYKFNKKVRKLSPLISWMPCFREFFTMSAYYILKKK